MPNTTVKNRFSLKNKLNIREILDLPPLDSAFFQRSEVVEIAKDLLGKCLISNKNGIITAGIIVETEAYSGMNDRACHAHNKKRTPRTETMFLPGGHSYVYLCYGLHHLFNVVTNVEGEPDAVLIRAVHPCAGQEVMAQRRKKTVNSPLLTKGPACVAQALDITRKENGWDLTMGKELWIADYQTPMTQNDIVHTTRIGVAYAGEDAQKPWRFYWKNNPWVSAL